MISQPGPHRESASGSRSIWVKYAFALVLSFGALAAGLLDVSPWPESGFVSSLILLATGPFFALRLTVEARSHNEQGTGHRTWGRLPWLTAALGLFELIVIFMLTVQGR
jgi:hypothetical protein